MSTLKCPPPDFQYGFQPISLDITKMNPLSLIVLCNFVLHQPLAAVKPHVTVFAGNVSSSPTLTPSGNKINSRINPLLTPALQVQVPADERHSSCAPWSWTLSYRWCNRSQNWSYSVPSTWRGIWLTLFGWDGQLHGPPTYVWTGCTLFQNSWHRGCTGPASRAGRRVTGDLVPWEDVSSSKDFSKGLAGVRWWEVHKAVPDKDILL